MAHDIATINGLPAIAYFGETPWHSLGQVLTASQAIDFPAAIRAAQLDWTVRKQPHFVLNQTTGLYDVTPFSQAVIRESDGVVLGSVGPNTEVVQNSDAFSILEPLVNEFGATIETAGALAGGSQVWMLLRVPQSIEPVAGDRTDAFLLLRHAHDNTHLLEIIPTLIRVVCKNTSRLAVAQAGGENTDQGRLVRIKKTASSADRVKEAQTLVRRLGTVLRETETTLRTLATTSVTPAQVATLIEEVFPYPFVRGKGVRDSETIAERRQTVAREVFTSPGAELAGSNLETGATTAYAVLQAITYYFDHVRPTEAKSESAVRKAKTSALFGANAAAKDLALAKVRELVAA